MDLKVLEWTVWTRFGSERFQGGVVVGNFQISTEIVSFDKTDSGSEALNCKVVKFLFQPFPRGVPFWSCNSVLYSITFYDLRNLSPAFLIYKANEISGSCDRASLTQEKKEPTDDTSKDVYSLLAQHVSGIITPIVRRQTE